MKQFFVLTLFPEMIEQTLSHSIMGREVPEVLLSGHHGNVAKWRREQALIRTAKKRPDLLKKAVLTKQDIAFLQKQGITIEETE